MSFFTFSFPSTSSIGSATASVTIESVAPDLPWRRSPRLNQLVNEAISGERQAVQRGSTRTELSFVFSGLSDDEYTDLSTFIETSSTGSWTDTDGNSQTGGAQYLLNAFRVTDDTSGDYWEVYLDAEPVYEAMQGKRWRVELEVVEKI